MGQRSVRVVVGQGDPGRDALRDVLARDGFDVVGEVTVAADLAEVLAAAQPDVVVLDDAIGVDAAQIVSQVAPDAKLVVIWPAGVVPIGGAVRVDPGQVAMALSATVGLAAGVELSGLGTIDRPDWIDKVRKDPATLREKLATGASLPVRPSVTELQRRGQRLHPSTGMGRRRSARSTGDGPPAAETVLPIAAVSQIAEPGGPTTAGAPVDDDGSEATLNRRIGMIALGGAAVASALMIALSFGTQRQPSLIVAEPFLPPLVSNSSPGDPPTTPVDRAPTSGGPTTPAPPAEPTSRTGGPGVTTRSAPSGATTDPTGSGSGGSGGSGSGGSGSGGSGSGGSGSGGSGSGGSGSGGSGSGGSGSGGSGAGRPSAATAGTSSSHNPHGGAPGLLRTRPVNAAASSAHANGHTPHGEHPTHPAHPHKR